MRVLVAGTITLTPGKREEALAGAKPYIDDALTEPGCVAYDWTPDPYTDDVVHVFEEWESVETLVDI